MTTTLITGANKGLGYETARLLIAAGHSVYARARDPERGRRAAELSKTADLAIPGGPVHFYPGVAYPASKTAVNTLTVQYAKAFPAMRINAVDPGYTATDLNGGAGTQTAAEGAEIVVRMAQIGPDGPTGEYFDARGRVAW